MRAKTAASVASALVFAVSAAGCSADGAQSTWSIKPSREAPLPAAATPTRSSATQAVPSPAPSAPPTSSSTPTQTVTATGKPTSTPASGLSGFQVYLNQASVWAPDGQHLLASVQHTNGGAYETAIVSADGVVSGFVPGTYMAWFDSSTVIADETEGLNFWPGPNVVQLYGLNGYAVKELQHSHASAVMGLGHATVPVDSRRFKVWDGDALSEPIRGDPVEWSPDGTRLATLHPVDVPIRIGPGHSGTIEVLDDHGVSVMSLTDWAGTESSSVAFSPDNRYLAIDGLSRDAEKVGILVIDTQTGAVEVIRTESFYGYLAWTLDDALWFVPFDGPISTWTPDQGVTETDIPGQTHLSVSGGGSAAYWEDGSSKINVRAPGKKLQIDMPGSVTGASWTPDGSRLAVTYAIYGTDDAGAHLVVLEAPEFAVTAP